MNVYQQNKHAHSVGWSTWHFEWCTKYRYKIFRKLYLNNLCVIAVHEAAKRHKLEIIEMEVDLDHIHVICSIPLTMAPARAVKLLKGCSAKILFSLVPNFRKRYPKGNIWSAGKFTASIGHITLEKAKAYVEAHHAEATRPFTGSPACGTKWNKASEARDFSPGRMSLFLRIRFAYFETLLGNN